MLLRNIGPALRVSVGPGLIALAVVLALGALGLGGVRVDAATGQVVGSMGGAFLGALVSGVLLLVVLSWVAVAWHRYVLLQEEPGTLPAFRSELVWPYLGRSIVIALVLVVLAIPLGFVASLLAAPVLAGGAPGAGAAIWGAVIALAMGLVLGWAGSRLSLTLPARAVGRPMTFGESWAATAPASGAILGATAILVAINVALALVFQFALGANLVSRVLDLVVQWATAMLGLSILTTLYGHLVEGRSLNP